VPVALHRARTRRQNLPLRPQLLGPANGPAIQTPLKVFTCAAAPPGRVDQVVDVNLNPTGTVGAEGKEGTGPHPEMGGEGAGPEDRGIRFYFEWVKENIGAYEYPKHAKGRK